MKNMTFNILKKGTAVALCASLCVSGGMLGGCGSTASSATESGAATEETADAADADETVSDGGSGEGVAYKEEKVYAVTDMTGKVTEITVSDWMKNDEGLAVINDKTTLTDVVNTKGDEEITVNGEDVTIAAAGNDVYYQGTSTDSLPVELSLSYKLDGQSIDASELEGATGELEITINYKNNATVDVDGEETTVPFLAATAIMASSDNFSNVEVSSGKVITNGDYDIIVAYALPGLSDALDLSAIDSDKVDEIEDKLTDEVTITADVTDCEIKTMMSMYSASLFDETDEDSESADASDVEDDIDKLVDATDELVDGTSELADGADELDEGTDKLTSGVTALSDGNVQITKGARTLSTSLKSLKTSAKSLVSGVKQVSSGASSLSTGLQQLYTGMKSAKTGAASLSKSLSVMSTKVAELPSTLDTQAEGYESIASGANTLAEKYKSARDTLESSRLEGLSDGTYAVYTAMATAAALNSADSSYTDVSDLSSAYDQLKVIASAQASDATYGAYAPSVYSFLDGCYAYYLAKANQATGAAAALSTVADSLEEVDSSTGYSMVTGVAAAATGASDLSEGMATIYSNMGTAVSGAKSLSTGASKLEKALTEKDSDTGYTFTSGITALSSGSTKLYKGSSALGEGIDTLSDGADALSEGTGKLSDGAQELADGMKEFKEEGIDEISDLFDDLTGVLDDVSGVADAAKEYKTFTALADGADGEVTFIVKSE
ncbi:MAG: hypothetical protein K5840_01490 [Eubacterium sp.]|nr:hypothetical protein [Eubacterium sp.]